MKVIWHSIKDGDLPENHDSNFDLQRCWSKQFTKRLLLLLERRKGAFYTFSIGYRYRENCNSGDYLWDYRSEQDKMYKLTYWAELPQNIITIDDLNKIGKYIEIPTELSKRLDKRKSYSKG